MNEPRVLFILGKGRSGSTLLDNALNGVEGVFSMGEVWVWGRSAPFEDHVCGCGRRVHQCPLWTAVLSDVRGELPNDPLETLPRIEAEVFRWRSILSIVRRDSEGTIWPALQSWSRFATALYLSVARRTGSTVLIDSSKWPGHPAVWGHVREIEPYGVQLVRDPRAVAHSWRRHKRWNDDGAPMPRFSSVYSALSWNARNALAELARRRLGDRAMLLRYENLATDPERALRDVLRLIGMEKDKLPLVDDRTLQLEPNHTLMGNPGRFRTGEVQVRLDDEWRTASGKVGRVATTLLTLPLLTRYGYPLRGEREWS